MKNRMVVALILLLTTTSASLVYGDAASDLAAGREALKNSKLDEALPLLTSATQGLPQSVEAHIALAECYIRLGQIEKALSEYTLVVKLSPQHDFAKSMVSTLTARQSDAEKQVETARVFVELGDYDKAGDILRVAIRKIGDDKTRTEVQLLLAETYLWDGQNGLAVSAALVVVERSLDPVQVATARAIAATALASSPEKAEAILAGTKAPEPWGSRLKLLETYRLMAAPEQSVAASESLLRSLQSIPTSKFRTNIQSYATLYFDKKIELALSKNQPQEALNILWPKLSNRPLPKPDRFLTPIAIEGGWGKATSATQQNTAKTLFSIGHYFCATSATVGEADLYPFWLASEYNRQRPGGAIQDRLTIAQRLEQLRERQTDAKPNAGLSPADAFQFHLLKNLAPEISTNQMELFVNLALQHVENSGAANKWEPGLSGFVKLDLDAQPPRANLAVPFSRLPRGAHYTKFVHSLANTYASIGKQQQDKDRKSVLAANDQALQPADMAALALHRINAGNVGSRPQSDAAAMLIVQRYAGLAKWEQADNALSIYYALQDADGLQWARIRLATQRVANTEDGLLSAKRSIGDKLAPALQTALQRIDTLLSEDASKSNRTNAIALVNQLTTRYAQLGRPDLVDAVVNTQLTMDEKNVKQLDDWAMWMKAHFIGQRANLALSEAVVRADDVAKLPIHPLHKEELDLLNQLVTRHPTSAFAPSAVNAVLRIASTYENNRVYSSARLVLADFIKAQPKLNQAEAFEYQIVNFTLSEARYAFSQREDLAKPPVEILPAHVQAIDSLAAFLKKHPTGDYSPIVVDELFAIARQYGEARAWPVTREIVKRFANAVPDFRSPDHLKLVEAGTYLGQLDQQRGLSLLTPAPAPPATPQPGSGASGPGQPGPDANRPGDEESDDINVVQSSTPFADTPQAAPQPAAPAPSISGGGGFGGGRYATLPQYYSGRAPVRREATASSLANIRQAEQRQFDRIALLEGQLQGQGGNQQQEAENQSKQSGLTLPSGVLLTQSEMKRQDEAADSAYLILIQLIKARTPDKTTAADIAKSQVLWMFDFFEGQLRADQTIVLIKRYLTDHESAPDRIALAYRVLTDSIVWARQNQSSGNIDQAWVAKRHKVFEEARREIADFIEKHADEKQWKHAAYLLAIESYGHEAKLVGALSRERAAGLLVQSANQLLQLPNDAPDHPQLSTVADRIFALATQIRSLGQNEQAIYVLRQITLKYPTHGRSNQSLVQIAQLYATGMQNPLRAVETYQEYLSRVDGDTAVPPQIFSIAKQLADQKRYLESLHVYGVFVDSFPTHAQAAGALHAIGKTHQANAAWQEAIDTYERIIEEYAGNAAIPQVKLDIAECQINLGEWYAARKQYEEYLEEFPKDSQVATAQARLEVLKKLDRFQDLLADDQIDRNKDDAQFQIGLTVLNELSNPVKAVEEFRKVIAKYGDSDVADDAQMSIGRTLLTLGRLDEGREELLKVPANHPNSPFSDDALFLIGQSYEQHAVGLAKVTQDAVRAQSHVMEQLDAYYRFNKQIALEKGRSAQVRGELKAKGDKQQLALNEAVDASRLGNLFNGQLYCEVTQAELETETETAIQIANRQDRINDAYREAVVVYMKAATDYPLGDKTDQSLLRIAQIFETRLKDRPAAMQTYQKVVKLFPGTPVAEDAAWKVTQFHVEEGQHAQAAEAYKNFIRNYPASQRVADAQFGLAEVMEQLGRWVDAMDAYEVFRQKFAKHPKVKLATQQIGWIKTYRK